MGAGEAGRLMRANAGRAPRGPSGWAEASGRVRVAPSPTDDAPVEGAEKTSVSPLVEGVSERWD